MFSGTYRFAIVTNHNRLFCLSNIFKTMDETLVIDSFRKLRKIYDYNGEGQLTSKIHLYPENF